MNVPRDETVTQLADLFKILGDASRLRIVLSCMEDRVSVGDIAEQLGLSSSLVSHHLRLLRGARIVKVERRGKQMFYSACDRHIECVIEDMVAHVTEPIEEIS